MLTLTKPTSIHTHHNTYIKLCDGYWLRYAYERKGVSRLHTTIKQFFKSINSHKNRLLSRRYHHHHHFDSPRADIFAAKGLVHFGSSCPWKWIWLKKTLLSGSQVSILTAKSNHLANLNKYNQKKKWQLMQIQTAGLIHEKMCESQSWLYFQYVEK